MICFRKLSLAICMENGLEKGSASLYYKGSEKKIFKVCRPFGLYYGGCLLTPSLEG